MSQPYFSRNFLLGFTIFYIGLLVGSLIEDYQRDKANHNFFLSNDIVVGDVRKLDKGGWGGLRL